MNTELLAKIDQEIENATAQIAADTIKFVNIRSVQESPLPGAPFGPGPRKVLDTFLEMSRADGLYTTDYGVGVVSAAMQEGQPDLGIWLHGDVVPEGTGWNFEPYNAVEYKGCIIGRGATDNKGQLSAIYRLFMIFKKLGIDLKYNPAIYVGSNEENGMADLAGIPGNPDAKGFLNVCTPPRMSLVPDSSWPVGYGGKGSVSILLQSKTPLHGITLTAGNAENPGVALAILDRTDVPEELPRCTVKKSEKTEISSYSPPRHGANPDPNGNMITYIAGDLLDAGLVADEDKYIFEFLKTISADVGGHCLDIDVDHPVMGLPKVFTHKVSLADGCPQVHIRIRYTIALTLDELRERISNAADRLGFNLVDFKPGTPAYLLDPNAKEVQLLTKIANQVTGEDKAPYTMSGGTYAHRLPNAYAYGASGNLPPEDFPKGRGGAHGVDECVSLFRLKRAMRIYARTLLELNDILG